MSDISGISPLVTLTTDFGLRDVYAAVMKGVILSICPAARIVDITHNIPQGNVREAAFQLRCAAPYFPEGAVHVIVVDPGVGTARRAVAVEAESARYVAPDNGVLSLVLRQDLPNRCVHLTNRDYWCKTVSNTFHGRDVFAPVGAHLAAGIDLAALGPAIGDLVRIPFPDPVEGEDGGLCGEIIHVDRFGNCISNITKRMTGHYNTFEIEGGVRIVGLSSSYASGQADTPLAIIGSANLLEIAVRNGSAAETLGIGIGTKVFCRLPATR